ncbi:DUF4352 domain-containing protein [Streptomyces mashuensis]|nr:DUF4352 domain-containing protein [Streptomyces mashuensis]
MRRQLGTALIVVAIAATATACNNDADASGGPGAATSAAPAPAASQGGALSVGGTATLKGKGEGVQVGVTLKSWVDPAQSANKFMKPAPGKRWVAAQLEIVNTGKAAYSDSPANGVKVVDEKGETFTHSMGEITAGPNMPASVKLAPGEKTLGYVVVAVPENAKPRSVRFATDSGFGKDTGEWTVTK